MRQRPINVFSLSFLDVMSCGFGAIILFFMIINADTVKRKENLNQNLQGEVERLEEEVIQGRKYLVELKNSIQENDEIVENTEGQSKRIIEQIQQKREELAEYENDTLAQAQHINKLKADLKSLEEANKRLEAGAIDTESQGESLVHVAGQGQRQYITGLTISGEHLVILIDVSASMLADRIVNVIRNRILPNQDKIRAAKWQRAVKTMEWISTRIPRDSKFQVIAFNDEIKKLGDPQQEWLDGGNPKHLSSAIGEMRRTIPEKGTSLFHAFEYIQKLEPRPDNVYLITDGLPTQGESKPFRSKVSSEQRLRHFFDAVAELPGSIPINVILFPMEGDPQAASAYWMLASRTSGVFFSPANDWP
ncbi:MAG: VWA domain-containing protein [Pseudomonadota bacterium]